jgi:hypothetical protein
VWGKVSGFWVLRIYDFAAAIQDDLGELSRVGKGEWFLGVADIVLSER